MSKPAFDIADIQKGAKKLNSVTPQSEAKADAKGSSSDVDEGTLTSLEELYEKLEGDLDLMYV